MKRGSSSKPFDEDEYPKVTSADMERAVLRVNLRPVSRKQRVTLMLDSGVIAFFKGRAGDRGYQTLINDTLKQAVGRESLEALIRRLVRLEVRRQARKERLAS